MAQKKSYSELLKDPRWQKKRLQVLDRDKFTCTICGDGTTELHVHHKKYLSGKKPWEYKLPMMTTLCSTCHSDTHRKDNIYNSFVGFNDKEINQLLEFSDLIKRGVSSPDLWNASNIIHMCQKNGLTFNKVKDDIQDFLKSYIKPLPTINTKPTPMITEDRNTAIDDILAMFDED